MKKLVLSFTLLLSVGGMETLDAKSEENRYYQLQQQKEAIVKRTISRLAKEITNLLPTQQETHSKLVILLAALDIVSESSLACHSVNALLQIKLAELANLLTGELADEVFYEELLKMASDKVVVAHLTEEQTFYSANILLTNKLAKRIHFDWVTHIAGWDEKSHIHMSRCIGSNQGDVEPQKTVALNSGVSFDPSHTTFGSKTIVAIRPEGGKRFIFIIDKFTNYLVSADEAGDVVITPVIQLF